jgi:hypothetical protein
LGALLDPLKLKINEFQAKIEDTYIKEGNERTALGMELRGGYARRMRKRAHRNFEILTDACEKGGKIKVFASVFKGSIRNGSS